MVVERSVTINGVLSVMFGYCLKLEEHVKGEVRWRYYYILVTSFEDGVYKLLCFHMYRPVLTRERKNK